jgi:acyl-coenzyme A synthetase/AMP-(fatty) acid ligase
MKSGCDNLTETSLKQWLSEQLIDIEIPTHVSFGSAIPTNSMGKRRDWTL